MSRSRVVFLILAAGICFIWNCTSPTSPTLPGAQVETLAQPSDRVEGLDFPFQHPGEVTELYCFGLQPWDTQGYNEIHGGIDLVVPNNLAPDVSEKHPITAPVDGRVEKIIESVSGAGVGTIVVVLRLNPFWYVICNFEPQTVNPDVFQEQRRNIYVREKQRVSRDDIIGNLVVRNVKPGSYPHLHFALLYKDPGDSWDYLAAHQLEIRRSDGTDLAPLTGLGSPWKAKKLKKPSTFFCPYVYSTLEAKALFDALTKKAANGDFCDCVCAYGSTNGDCGTCGH